MLNKQHSRRIFLKRSLGQAATLTTAGTLARVLGSCSKNPRTQEDRQTQEDRLRDAILSYLSQPNFSNPDFMEQVTGTKAELQVYDCTEEMLYLSIPTEYYSEDTIQKLSKNPKKVEFGKTVDGEFEGNRLLLGDYRLRKPRHYFFRFPSQDLKVEPSKTINVQFKTARYSLTMRELQEFIENSSVYGGYLNAEIRKDQFGTSYVIANHGAFVAKKGEPSLERLVASLVPDDYSKEQAAQKLLDFVTTELINDPSDTFAIAEAEVLKRPNEVLMTKGSDCSGKVILYASLLEQTDIDYWLIYSYTHISVAVEGNYGNANGLSYQIENKIFSLAETTVRGFQIGQSSLNKPIEAKDIKYIQKPGKNSKILDANTGKPLPFI